MKNKANMWLHSRSVEIMNMLQEKRKLESTGQIYMAKTVLALHTD